MAESQESLNSPVEELVIVNKTQLKKAEKNRIQSLEMEIEKYKQKRDFEQQMILLIEFTALKERQEGTIHLDVAEAEYDLGMCYLNVGRHAEALKALTRSLQIRETISLETEQIAQCCSVLSLLYNKMGKMNKCIAAKQRAIRIWERLGVVNHCLQYTDDVMDLAAMLQRQNHRVDETISLLSSTFDQLRPIREHTESNESTSIQLLQVTRIVSNLTLLLDRKISKTDLKSENQNIMEAVKAAEMKKKLLTVIHGKQHEKVTNAEKEWLKLVLLQNEKIQKRQPTVIQTNDAVETNSAEI